MYILLSLCRSCILYDQSWRSGHCATKAPKQVCQGHRHVDWGVQTDGGQGKWWRLLMQSNHVSLSLILRVKLCPNSQQKNIWYLKLYFTLNLPLYKKMFVNSWFSKAMQSDSMKYDIAMVAYCYGGRQT